MAQRTNILLLFVFLPTCSGETVTVDTTLGSIEGQVIQTPDGFEINSFKGIPYAKPPIGELRFEKPVPVEPWDTKLNATEWAPRCYFLRLVRSEEMDKLMEPTSEDCLYLNVFAPKATSPNFPNDYPVMFWVHGGCFVLGSAAEYDIPQGLIRKDVIFVSIQYRLSLLGFFATEHGMGNMGLWDQTLALQWVKDNIGDFGGDPSRITVFGESAGGVSASILSISPHSSGLFQNVIPMSGSATNEWGARTGTRKEDMFKFCNDVATHLDCTGTSREKLDCLRKIPAKKVEEAQEKTIDSQKRKGLFEMFCTVGPVIDELPILPAPMYYAVNNFNSFMLEDFEKKTDALLREQNYRNVELIKRLVIHEFLNSKQNANDSNFLTRQWTEVVGDWMITRQVVNENLARTNLDYPVWFYNFEHFNPATFPEGFRILMECAELLRKERLVKEDILLANINKIQRG